MSPCEALHDYQAIGFLRVAQFFLKKLITADMSHPGLFMMQYLSYSAIGSIPCEEI
jgi:hypothetical protein